MKIVILGGGASGLGVAWGLVELGHTDIIIVEKENRLGGLSGSISDGSNTIDFGPHRFSPEYPDVIQKLRGLLGEDLLEVANEHAVVFRGKVYRYPPRIIDFLNIPTIITSARAVSSFVWERVKSVARALFRIKPAQETFERIIVSRFGRMLYKDVVEPICNKVWGDASSLDPEFANLRFSVPTIVQWGKKLIGYQGNFNDKSFYYPRKGFQQAWDTIGEHLKAHGVKILLESEATEIALQSQRASAVTIKSKEGTFTTTVDWVVSTIPTHRYLRLLRPSPFTTQETLSAKFSNRGMLLACYLVNRPVALPARVVIAPEAKYFFNRLSEQNQFSRDTVKAGHSLVLADVLTEFNSETWKMNDREFLDRVAKDIEACGFFGPKDIVEATVQRVPMAYPLPTADREREQERFNQVMANFTNVICTGRFASSDYNNAHTALKKGLLAAESIHKQRTVSEWYEVADGIRKTAIRD
jgi:protoporphyrinogen oxidase